MDYDKLVSEEGYQVLDMEMNVYTGNGLTIKTTRCPLHVDGELLLSSTGAPLLGEHTAEIDQEFGILKDPQSLLKSGMQR